MHRFEGCFDALARGEIKRAHYVMRWNDVLRLLWQLLVTRGWRGARFLVLREVLERGGALGLRLLALFLALVAALVLLFSRLVNVLSCGLIILLQVLSGLLLGLLEGIFCRIGSQAVRLEGL